MKLALAQINMRLGDVQGVCERIAEQSLLAKKQGVDLVCFPVPLFSGIDPGGLAEDENHQHDILMGLSKLASRLDVDGPACLVPVIAPLQGSQLYDVVLLNEGRAVPLRSLLLQKHEGMPFALWATPVFDIAGARVAVALDPTRDMSDLPQGCDIIIYFQLNAFDITQPDTAGVAGLADSNFPQIATKTGLWLALMAPVGGFDEAIYTGGSFVMDDMGHVVSCAPCFEEFLLVQEVERGIAVEPVPVCNLPVYNREIWLWNALKLYLRDAVTAQGFSRVVVHLDGGFASTLLAVLAMDALGTRNVLGVLMMREDMRTPAETAHELERASLVRSLASRWGIRLIERSVGDGSSLADSDVAREPDNRELMGAIEGLCLNDTARRLSAMPLSALCKTDYALAVGLSSQQGFAMIAPFGDVYLSELEFLGRCRNRLSPVIPSQMVSLATIEKTMNLVVGRAVMGAYIDATYTARVRDLFARLQPSQVDNALEAHIDKGASFEDIPLSSTNPEALALLLLLVRRGEMVRRRLPLAPVVSARAFTERAWPVQLAWSDLGRQGEPLLSVERLAAAEIERLKTEQEPQDVKKRLMELIGGVLGLNQEQMEGLQEGMAQHQVQIDPAQIEQQMRELMGGVQMPGQHGISYFSQN